MVSDIKLTVYWAETYVLYILGTDSVFRRQRPPDNRDNTLEQ